MERILQWLTGYSDLLVAHFHNRMPVMAGILAVEIMYLWLRARFGR